MVERTAVFNEWLPASLDQRENLKGELELHRKIIRAKF